MKKNLAFFVLLAFLFLPGQKGFANTYHIYQDVLVDDPDDCENTVINGQSIWSGANITVEMTHDMTYVSGAPGFASLLNNSGYRYFYFDIYDVDVFGNESLEATVVKYHHILHNGVISGFSSVDYGLVTSDLITAGISGGDKVVKLRVKMSLTGKSHTIIGHILKNGTELCTKNPLDGFSMVCDLGKIDCFNYSPCDADLNVYGYATSEPQYDRQGNIVGYISSYTYNASVVGVSGSYSYAWNSNGSPSTGSNQSYTFTSLNSNPTIYLAVTDTETGCVYYWSTNGKTNATSFEGAFDLMVGPNPAFASDELTVKVNLPVADSYQLGVYDLNGRLMLDLPAQVGDHVGEYSHRIQQSLAPGVYLLRVQTAGHGNMTRKITIL